MHPYQCLVLKSCDLPLVVVFKQHVHLLLMSIPRMYRDLCFCCGVYKLEGGAAS